MAESESDDCFMMVDDDFDNGPSTDEENVVPKKKKAVKTIVKKTSTNAIQKNANSDNVLVSKTNMNTSNSAMSVVQKEKSVEERYQKKSQIEHILIRPDTYST
jgi:hypothetical protein